MRDRNTTVALLVATGAAVLILPHGTRLALSVPVLVDEPGLAAGLAWLFLFTSRNRYVAAASLPVAVLAVATREVWAFVIVTACCVCFWWGPRVVAVANAGVALVAFWWVHQIESLPSANFFFPYPGDGATLRFWLDFRFSDLTEVAHMIWAILFVVGLIPVVLVLRSPLRWLRSELDRGEITAVALLVSGALLVGTAPFLGSDLTRLAYPGAVLVLIVALAWVAANPALGLRSILLALASLYLWAPAHSLIATKSEYIAFYYPWSRTRVGLIVSFAVVACVVVSPPRPRDAAGAEPMSRLRQSPMFGSRSRPNVPDIGAS